MRHHDYQTNNLSGHVYWHVYSALLMKPRSARYSIIPIIPSQTVRCGEEVINHSQSETKKVVFMCEAHFYCQVIIIESHWSCRCPPHLLVPRPLGPRHPVPAPWWWSYAPPPSLNPSVFGPPPWHRRGTSAAPLMTSATPLVTLAAPLMTSAAPLMCPWSPGAACWGASRGWTPGCYPSGTWWDSPCLSESNVGWALKVN